MVSDGDMKKSDSKWVKSQINQFEKIINNYKIYAQTLEIILQHLTRQYSPSPIIQVRNKSIVSFAEKIQKKNYDKPFLQMTDLCGGRIITNTIEEKDNICKIIENCFEIDWENSSDVSKNRKSTEFGYRSVHYIVKICPKKLIDYGIDSISEEAMEKIRDLKAEIQVRTIIDHSYADFSHKYAYKSKYAIPSTLEREIAGVAAMGESIDSSLLRIKKKIEFYTANYLTYMKEEDIKKEIEILENILDYENQNLNLVYRIGRLAISIKDWGKVIDLHQHYVGQKYSDIEQDIEYPLITRDLGIAKCKKTPYNSKKDNNEYNDGVELLKRAKDINPNDLLTVLSYAESLELIPGKKQFALDIYSEAFEIDPSDYYSLVKYVLYETNYNNDFSFIRHLKPSIKNAILRCKEHVDLNMNIPQVYYDMGKLYYFSGELNKCLENYTTAIRLSDIETIQEEIRNIELIIDAKNEPSGEDMVYDKQTSMGAKCIKNILDLAVKAKNASLESDDLTNTNIPIVVTGSCNEEFDDMMESFSRAFSDFKGTIISGGTKVGVCGLVGNTQDILGENVKTLGFLPESKKTELDGRYSEEPKLTRGNDFSVLEPITYWKYLIEDLKIPPSMIKVLGIGGGNISSIEYRMALAFGATVAIICGSGGEGERLILEELKMNDRADLSGLLVRLPDDPWTIKKYVEYNNKVYSKYLAKESFKNIAKVIHDNYTKDFIDGIVKNKKKENPNLKDWDDLRNDFKDSNLLQAIDIERKLDEMGFKLRNITKDEIKKIEFTEEEIERMSEMEHARWNIERLLFSGWKWGEIKDADNKISPWLVSWDKLPDDIKQYDRDAIKNIPILLAKHGIEIYR